MPFLTLDNGDVFDDELISLSMLLDLLDARRVEIDTALVGCEEESPLHEVADDLAGFGFVACQKYLTSIAAEVDIKKGEALRAGPTCPSGETVATFVNAVANAWKHGAEWKEELTPQQDATLRRLQADLADGAMDYLCVNALYLLSPTSRFAPITDQLRAWRDDVRRRAAARSETPDRA